MTVGLDLRYLRPSLDDLLLIDTCDVHRDALGGSDDVTDLATGVVTTGGATVVATAVPCKVKTVFRHLTAMESGAANTVSYCELSLSATTAFILRLGDRVRIASSVHNADLVGQWFRVTEQLHGSVRIFRKFKIEIRGRQDDRP